MSRGLLLLVALAGCARDPFHDLPVNDEIVAPLAGEAHVVWTASGVPHVYAENRADVGWVTGWVLARDRFFTMDLVRHTGRGTLSELLGDVALDTDLESRGSAMAFVAQQVWDHATPEQVELYTAFADGVSAWVEAAKAGDEDVPPEYELLAGLVGADSPESLMTPFVGEDIAAIASVLVYQSSYETGDVGRDAEMRRVEASTPFAGAALHDERLAGFEEDVLDDVKPIMPVASAYGVEGTEPRARRAPRGEAVAQPVNDSMIARLERRLARIDARLDHDREIPWGSNAWAVAGSGSADGRALVAGDGHLGLDLPPLFYRLAIDTEVLGKGGLSQIGVTAIGNPYINVGSNGKVAWQQTQFAGDITDWYREELVLDAQGAPAASRFQGRDEPLVPFEETFVVRDVPLLDSVGRTETWTRWTTFDGRWITAIEGRPASRDEVLGDGETLVQLLGDLVVPGDVDGDGVISAVSFDYTGLDAGNLYLAVDRMGRANDVVEFRQATRGLVAYSQNIAVGDSDGNILYTGFQAMPCRGYLPRDGEGRWIAGADPRRLLDGTTYGGFEIPFDADWNVAEGDPDPSRCVVGLDDYPHAVNPDRAYVATSNNDPGGMTLDGSIYDDPIYLGEGWNDGFRAARIGERLEAAIADGTATVAEMQSIQADHTSPMARHYGPYLVEALRTAKALAETDGPKAPHEERIVALWSEDPGAYAEVLDRLAAWIDRDCPAESGVETFYHQVGPGEVDDAVATMIFEPWLRRFRQQVLDDEPFPGGWEKRGPEKLLSKMLRSRGENTLGLGCFVEETKECAYFDRLGTEPIERMEEDALASLAATLAFLRSAPTGPGAGGFGTDDMSAWLWGLRHQARFESLVANELGGGPLASLLADFSVTTARLPLADDIDRADPRYGIKWFPRPGAWESVDAANFSGGGSEFTYGSGPVFRTVFALGPDDAFEAWNVLPGGQSGDPGSDRYDDQLRLWLGNEAQREAWTVDEVVEQAERHAVFGE